MSVLIVLWCVAATTPVPACTPERAIQIDTRPATQLECAQPWAVQTDAAQTRSGLYPVVRCERRT